MGVQNLKFVALPIPEIIRGYAKNLGTGNGNKNPVTVSLKVGLGVVRVSGSPENFQGTDVIVWRIVRSSSGHFSFLVSMVNGPFYE